MKVLYATYRYDPLNPDMGSGVDYENYSACLRAGFEMRIVGPVTAPLSMSERIEQRIWRFYKKISGKSGLKFPLTTSWRASQMLARSVRRENPNIILSIFPPFFVFYSGKTSYVWLFDTTFLGQEDYWPLYGKLPLMISTWQERRAFACAARLITRSEWSKSVLIQQYGVPASRIDVIPSNATLPADIIPAKILPAQEKKLESPLKLLLVGRVYGRKGIDIAIEVAKQLNAQGVPTQLTICGLTDREVSTPPFVQFVGSYRKSDPAQIKAYVDWYKWAHLLLHPARFEAAGIVPSEAAAFGTPTITNDVGGLATTVKHGESGIVLPRGSKPEAYVEAIRELISQPGRYYDLCHSTRQRYDRELNSDVAGKRLAEILQKVVEQHHSDGKFS